MPGAEEALCAARRVADAVLYEGYALYPYRASAAKNTFRWQIGLIVPMEYAAAAGSDPWCMQTECLVDATPHARLDITVRGLQVQQRSIKALEEKNGRWRAVDEAVVDGRRLVSWEEGVLRELPMPSLPLGAAPREWVVPVAWPGGRDVERVVDAAGRPAALIVRRRWAIDAMVRVVLERTGTLCKVRVRIENRSRCRARTLDGRPTAIRRSLAGTHTLLAVEGGAFVSLIDPPPAAADAAASCVNLHTWPVLAGPAGTRHLMLSAPVILPDHPAVAPESFAEFCDATEIDEMLTLRVATLTDAEKRAARATDDRIAQIIDRVETAASSTLSGLHGAVRRYAQAGPAPVAKGSRVRLRPSHRSDSLDMVLDGRLATVVEVYSTLEGQPYVTVTLDDDPAAAADPRFRRALFFHPDELEPLDPAWPRGEA